MLLAGLPPEALSRTRPEERVPDKWTLEVEMLAQIVEEVSVLAAEHRRKQPRRIPRPPRPGEANGVKKAINVLKATAAGRVRVAK